MSVLSVIFAEVTCYSSPYPFFDKWGLTVVLPLYGLHTLFLAGLIFRKKSVTLPILMLAGMLFGLYEAAITKVFWDPTWGGTETMFAGVAWLQTGVLTLFWHPWFAFILPLMAGELIFSSTNEVLNTLPSIIKNWAQRPSGKIVLISLLAFFCGVNQGANTISVQSTLISTAESLGVFLLFAVVWRLVSKNVRWQMRDLLPQGKELTVVGLLLALLYAISLPLFRPEALPHTPLPYIIILTLYTISIALLLLNTSKAEPFKTPLPALPRRFHWFSILLFVCVYLASSVYFFIDKSTAGLLIVIAWGLGIITCLWVLLRSLVAVIGQHK
ncbi:MAG: hypothetical protein FP831_16655 [Anaerolineae bacterium]|nr:hypothetical protein [Anaerolineae bacterium]